MTGKPFIMAVIRKINKRLSDYRRRRAIEKSEQEYYDDLDTDDDDDIPNEKPESRVRYGVRRMPGRRMGTMNVSFTKKGENEPEKNTAAKSDKVNANAKSGQTVKDIRKDPILEKERETAKVTVETKKDAKAKPQVSQNLFIPGVGNVRLGKNQSNDVIEEEYTEKDFADVMDDQIHTETEEKPKRETFRKQDVFEDNERITSVGVKTLHSGSINRTSGNNITNITSIYQKAENDEVMNGDGNNITEDNADELYDNRIYENADEDELYEKESEQNVITPAEHKDSYDEDEKIINVLNNENPDDVEDTEDISEKSGEQEELPIRDDSEKVYSDEKNLAKHVNEILDEQKENVPEKVSEAVKAEKEYQKVTRIGSGAAVFTDMTKQPEKKPEKQNIPEYVFPPVSLLNKSKPQQSGNSSKRDELEATIQKLQSTFESFGVGVKVVDASVGPTVTRYELLPDQGVKVKTITSLSDDIKLALAAPEIRIEAPIPGKAAVGIEVPNKESSAVFFGDLIDTDEFRKYKSNLAFTVGKDIGGKSIISDIGDMPHALIAGATGSGKSVCINALIMSILYKSKPTDVKLIMIDPKRVELVGYNGIPHLIVPVVTDVKKAAGALAWAVSEMDNRYKLFADAGVRDLAAYNSHMVEKWMEESNEGECPDKLPQIVIIVDELNDLMMTANSKDIESDIARLTQLARACGIHVILATQRPSVNVITGTIKANIPTRIAFAVSSIVDSRTILDQAGAEKLLGKGDMLYYPRGYAKPVRLQGVFVSDKEVNEVVDFIKKQYKEMKYNELVSQHIEANSAEKSQGKDEGGQADANANDEFFEEAARLIIKKQKASVGMLQREFRIGFNRAARIMDKLAEDGIVGPEESTKPRKILMTMDEFEQYLNGK
ncbi:MAG: DNA translocase FtsK [Lachnospiraceae bacterium]|nr:DNA translocase FtsK [Lachnospiraceae bacterium]